MSTRLSLTWRLRPAITLQWLLLLATAASAAEYQGAGSVLQKVAEQSATRVEPKAPVDENAKLREDLAEFRKKVASLPPPEAAKGWLDLVDRRAKAGAGWMRHSDILSQPVRATELVAALPPPAAWEELKKAVDARPPAKGADEIREIGLRLLVSTLKGDSAARTKEIAALQSKAEKSDVRTVYFFKNVLEQISQAMLATLDDPEAVLKVLERQLATKSDRHHTVRVPNLVSLVGPAKAEEFLRRALLHETAELEIDAENETSQLARKLALELIDKLNKPQWGLVDSLDAVDLYEAMEKKFAEKPKAAAAPAVPELSGLPDVSSLPDPGDSDWKKSAAQTYYLLGLISKGRTKDAVAVATRVGKQRNVYLPHTAVKALELAGYTTALDQFFYELLSQDPTLEFWDEYVSMAAKARQTERMLKLARQVAAREDLSTTRKSVIHRTLFRALLAAEQVDEGVQEIRRLMNTEQEKSARYRGAELTRGDLGMMLAELGRLLQKPEWIEEGVAAVRKSIEQPQEAEESYWSGTQAGSLANLLLELNRGAEAEQILTDALAKAVAREASEAERNEGWGRMDGHARRFLEALASVYHKAGRHADVVTLLDQAPYWSVKDVAQLDRSVGRDFIPQTARMRIPSSGQPMTYIAASSLAAVGRKEEARKILDALLDDAPGFDRGYELLLQLAGESAIARLDELFARDQFEERPLIWKAELFRRQNKLEEAEKVVRQAISIDPSDGEQGRGDRLRAYAVLGEIRAARGDQKEADFLRGAIKAIRLAEEADKYYAAGLLKRAVAMYEESLKLFADAYCIQSRLAIQLAELGRHEEAEAHYRRAYELMPDSFGRVESHCFGCEKAFDGERAQTLAEKVFSEFAAKQPNKPQVHYLLGYLREEQGRHAQALQHFQTAVKLDPDYLNAWQKIQSLAGHVRLPAKEHDRIVFNVLRLDPLQRHAQASFDRVVDLAGLWNAIEKAQNRQAPKRIELYPLAASKVALEKKESDPKMRELLKRREMYSGGYDEWSSSTPGQAVARTAFVRVAAEMVAGDQLAYLEE